MAMHMTNFSNTWDSWQVPSSSAGLNVHAEPWNPIQLGLANLSLKGAAEQNDEAKNGRAPPPLPVRLLRKDSFGDSPFNGPEASPAIVPQIQAGTLPLHSPALGPIGRSPALGPSPALSFEVLRPMRNPATAISTTKATSPPPARAPPPPPPPVDNFPGLGSPRLSLREDEQMDYYSQARIWAQPGKENKEVEMGGKGKPGPGKPPTINYKGELNHVAQHVLKQPLTAKDVVFTSESDDDGLFRCTVTLPWHSNMYFKSQGGFLRKKDAEQRAAEVAVRELVREGVAPPETISTLPQPGLSPVASSRHDGRGKASDPDRLNCKGELNNLAMKLLKRPVADGDVVYTSHLVEPSGEYKSSLRLAWWTNWSFESVHTSKKKDAEQFAARIASDALVAASQLGSRRGRKVKASGPTFRTLIKRFLQVCDQPGEILWRASLEGAESTSFEWRPNESAESCEVELIVPWCWAAAPNGLQRFTAAKGGDASVSKAKALEALNALRSSDSRPEPEPQATPAESEASEVMDADATGESQEMDEVQETYCAGKYASILPFFLELTDPDEESVGDIAYCVSELPGNSLAVSMTWPSERGEFCGPPQNSPQEAEAAAAEVVCRHLLSRISPKQRRGLNKERKSVQALPQLTELVLGRPMTDEDISWGPVVANGPGTGFVARITLPWWREH